MKITDDMLTEWFPSDVKPVHSGVYLTTKEPDGEYTFYARWADGTWKLDADSIRVAALQLDASPSQNRRWKGMKEKHHG